MTKRILADTDVMVDFLRGYPQAVALIQARSAHIKMNYAKSHGVGLADAIIAATAKAENADLATLNVRHYPMLKGLKPAYTKASGEQPVGTQAL